MKIEELIAQAEQIPGEVGGRLEVLLRISRRGRLYFESKKDSRGVDLFQHMEDEIGWLISSLKKN